MKKPRLSGSLDYMSGGSGGDRRKSASGSLTFSGGLGSITPGVSYSKDSSRQQYSDGVVVDEFGRRIGLSINGELFLDEGGQNKLRAGASKDTMTGGYSATSGEELLGEDAYKQALERYFLGLDLGPLSLDVNKAGDDVSGRAAYRAGENMEFSVEDSNRGDPTFGFQFAKQFNEGGPVAAEENPYSILNLDPDAFVAALDELGLQGEERKFLTDQYFAQSRALPMTSRPEGKTVRTILPIATPEGMTGAEALMSGDFEFTAPELLRGLYEGPAEAINVASAIGKGVPVTEDQVQQAGQVVPEMITGIGPATFAARSLARGVEMPDPSVVSMSGVVPENDFYKLLTGQMDAPPPSTLPPPPQAVTLSEQLFSRAPVPESSNPIGPRAGVGPARPSDPKAEALGFKDTVYHSTLSPEEFTQFDLNKQITGGSGRSFQDFLGVHVGTAKAASDRNIGASETAAGYSVLTPQKDRVVDPQGYTMELRARTDNPLTKEKFAEMLGVPVEQFFKKTDGPFQERDFELLQNEYANELLGTMPDLARRYDENTIPRPLVAAYLRKDLADKGFTHIPYVNAVEDRGSTSFIMLTDRDGRSPAVLRDVRAGFDPSKVNDPDLRFSDGGAVEPDDFYSLMNSVDVFALR